MRKLLTLICSFCLLTLQAQTYFGTGGSIPDVSSADFTLNVAGLSPSALDTTHGFVRVCFNITHTYDSDLSATLTSPGGVTVDLFRSVGGGDDNFTNTCLDAHTTSILASGTAPFTGSFLPMGRVGNFNNGTNGNGNWILHIQDNAGADTGSLLDWSITFDTAAPSPFTFTSSNLPIVLINTYGRSIPDEPKIPAGMKIIYNGPGLRNYVTDRAYQKLNTGIEIRGASSASYPQKPYGFETRDSFGIATDVSIMGMPVEHDWILQATYNDKDLIRNTMLFSIWDSMGHYAARTRHVELVLNGEYQGIYFICEKIKRDANRVAIAKLDSNDNAGDSLTGGYIIKQDYPTAGWNSVFHPDSCSTRDYHYNFEYPSAANITPPQQIYIQSYVDSFERVLFDTGFANPVSGYRKYISDNSFIDYLIAIEFSMNPDEMKKSMYFHKDKLGKLKAGPIWDYDWAMKFMPWFPADVSGWMYNMDPCGEDVLFNPWFKRMMDDTTFQNDLRCRWDSLRTTVLDTDYVFHFIDSSATVLNEAQARHFERWGILGVDSGSPEAGPIPTTFSGEIERLKEFFRLRINWLDNNIPGTCYPKVDTTHTDTTHHDTTHTLIYNLYQDRVKVFPNPVQDQLQVELGEAGQISSLQLQNMQGQTLVEENCAKQSSLKFSMHGLSAGIYALTGRDDKGVILFYRKILKE